MDNLQQHFLFITGKKLENLNEVAIEEVIQFMELRERLVAQDFGNWLENNRWEFETDSIENCFKLYSGK